MFHTITTTRSIDDVISSLQEHAHSSGFSILHHYDFFTILEGKGFPIESQVWTFELCRASMASKMLSQFPLFSVMMPCRISVFEDAGTTHIATMDMIPMLDAIKEQAELYTEAKDLYAQILALMERIA